MLVLAVTHPDTISREPRSLSEGGRQQGLHVARRLREVAGKAITLNSVVSSPKARCLETAILVAREFGETTRDNGSYDGRICIAEELEERPGVPHHINDLRTVLNRFSHDEYDAKGMAMLLVTHGDLAHMLCGQTRYAEKAVSDGFFNYRPVIAILNHAPGGSVSVSCCEALQNGGWVSCLA